MVKIDSSGVRWYIPDDIALEEQLADDAHENIVKLADLSELQRARCTSEQETDDHEDWIVEDRDRDVFCGDSEKRCHDHCR